MQEYSPKYKVDVLLATFNGEKYISELLDSLLAQSGVEINLLISDDGSADKTLEIVHSYKDLFAKFEIYSGPKLGSAMNFLSLLEYSTSDFIAFADQDDIWLPNHLADSIKRISPYSNEPALSFSRVTEFDEKGRTNIWPKKIPELNFQSFIFENYARGCTLVFNSTTREVLKAHKPSYLIMHDWWIVLVVLSVGKVDCGINAEVEYRIHKRNQIGRRKPLLNRIFQVKANYVDGKWKPLRQLKELQTYEPIAHDRVRIHLVRNPILLMFNTKRLRSNLFEDLLIRLILILHAVKNLRATSKFFISSLKKMIARLIFYPISLFTRIKNFFFNFLLRKNNIFKIHKLNFELETAKQLAILVSFPRKELEFSTKRLIKTLKNSGFSILMVINENEQVESWIQKFRKEDISIISRSNIGRDFGAYKCGINFLVNKKSKHQFENVLIANDSVIYTDKSEALLTSTIRNHQNWTCLFKSGEICEHAQSFFEIFSSNIVYNKKFLNFWKNYKSLDSRKYMIHNGELELSKMIREIGYFVEPAVDFEQLINENLESDLTDYELESLWAGLSAAIGPQFTSNKVISRLRIKKIVSSRNQTHYLGLAASRLFGAPLKADIMKLNIVSEEGLKIELARVLTSTSEVENLMKLLTVSGDIGKFRKYWQSIGLI